MDLGEGGGAQIKKENKFLYRKLVLLDLFTEIKYFGPVNLLRISDSTASTRLT